ncbi:hypothetical protein MVAC_21493 [Mycolicibacterium vaccae ATCC 25954]|jgi:hypothetical protein|uniref:Uncharacterized protein n=2 Tax=Mycolicibacterium vaccae TaxID=1810 RepID=K0UNI6_MYCVA|nr:hypothetical protein MVAC_21493 [Mycolicibacterium vaccae ATCC 25954]
MESALTDFRDIVKQTTEAEPVETAVVRGAVIAGTLASIDGDARRLSFMRFREGFQGVQILTFDELGDRLRGLHAMLKTQP